MATPQPSKAALSSGMSFSILITDASLTVTYGENVPSRHIWMTGSSSRVTRYVLSEIACPVNRPAPSSQMFCRPFAQDGQRPHAG